MKQHTFSLLTASAHSAIEPAMSQPTGAMITVLNNDGDEISVPELHGGFVLIGALILNDTEWHALLGCGMNTTFAAMRTQLAAAAQASGKLVGVELATIDDYPDTEEPMYEQLDAAPTPQQVGIVNLWLTQHGFEPIVSTTLREMVVFVCNHFRTGFDIGQDYVS